MQDVYVTIQNSINGDGLYYPSLSIYFSGCDKPIKCKDCHNPELQKQKMGYKTDYLSLINDLDTKVQEWLKIYPKISICYLGGEALANWNIKSTYEVSKYFKAKYKERICNIVYTWRYLKDLEDIKDYISYMDLGVLGDFEKELFVENQIPASYNQYIYDFNKKIKLKRINKED